MTTDYEQLANAEQIIAARESGDYDDALGIAPDERAALTKARAGDRITLDDFRALMRLGEYDLADQAHNDDRIDFDQEN